MQRLSKTELIKLVKRIINVDYDTEKEHSEAVFLFKQNVPHPEASNLIYRHEPELSPEEIVEKALAYKPIILPPPEDFIPENKE